MNPLCNHCKKPCDHFSDKFCSARCVHDFFKGKTKEQKREFLMNQDAKKERE